MQQDSAGSRVIDRDNKRKVTTKLSNIGCRIIEKGMNHFVEERKDLNVHYEYS